MILDSHVHVWVQKPEIYPWQAIGGYVPQNEASAEMLLSVMDAAGVDGAVLVQPTPYGWDNRYLMDCVKRYPDRFRGVCLVDPLAASGAQALQRLVEEEDMRGVRINWTLQPDAVWQTNPHHRVVWETARDLGVPVCLQMTAQNFGLLGELAREYPQVKIVVDHLGRPVLGEQPASPSFVVFLELARLDNIYIKLSGLNYYSEEKAPYQDVWPLLQAVCREFGAARCMWGSDFPFVQEHWSYAELLATVQNKLQFEEAQLAGVLGGTAQKLWWQSGQPSELGGST